MNPSLSRTIRAVLSVGLAATAAFAAAPKDIGKQGESDWVDARWNNTDIGNFHSSLIPLPNGTVAKGLSIRLPVEGAGSITNAGVAYDTETATLRAGWTGAFLKFDGKRYGLINPPQPAGEFAFVSPAAPAWGDQAVTWRGLHVHGPSVVLDYSVGSAAVLETAGLETVSDHPVFTRSFEIAALNSNLLLTLFDAKAGKIALTNIAGATLATIAVKPSPITVAVSDGAHLRLDAGTLKLELPASPKTLGAKVFIATGTPDIRAVATHAANHGAGDLARLAAPAQPRWRPLTTRGQRGFGNAAFIVDTLTVPYDNPFNALFFTSGVDFLPNGDAAVCTIHGDVWLVSGIDDSLNRLTWHRFATGLFQPLGLRVRDGKVYVLGRDRITVLHDQNGDGEADFYESFFSGIRTSTSGHDYVTSLCLDTNGNFYYVDPKGAHRVKRDGSGEEIIASGWRNPNGMGVSPDGTVVTIAPQQGEWTPSSAISEARTSGWYGYGGPRVTAERPLGYDPHLCWIPHSVDNSGGSQLWVTSEKWAPLAGHMIHFCYGRCSQFLVMREVVDGVAQGAITPLPGRFLSGAMRGAFNPKDGQLYVVGSTGWQTSAVRDGCLQRVRFTGANPLLPVETHAYTNGFGVAFTTPLDRATAEDLGSYSVSQWNYNYSAKYGSKDYSVADPTKEGHDTLVIKSVRLLPDGHSVFLEVPGLGPVMQYEIKYSLNSADGKTMRSSIWGTINRPAPAFTDTRTAQR